MTCTKLLSCTKLGVRGMTMTFTHFRGYSKHTQVTATQKIQ